MAGRILRHPSSPGGRPCTNNFQTSLLVSFSTPHREHGSQENRRALLLPCLRCQKDDDEHIRHVSVEPPPYNAYLDSSSGEMQPAFGARPAIPPEICWPEGTKDRVRAARAPEPTGVSTGSPSYGQQPGSRRKNYKTSAAASDTGVSYEPDDPEVVEVDEEEAINEANDFSSDYVSYETEPEEPTWYAVDFLKVATQETRC